MMHHDKVTFFSLKQVLFLISVVFAVAMLLLTILLTSAATATGSSPATAITLIDGVNTGILGPGEQRWFRIVPRKQNQAPKKLEQSLTLIFTSAHIDSSGQFVSMQIFDGDQVRLLDPDDNSPITGLGVGQTISDDDNSEPGKLFWSDLISSDRTYYIQILNSSDFPVDYWLIPQDVSDQSVDIESEIKPFAPAVLPDTGTDPGHASPLMPGANRGNLKPHTIYWYTFIQNDFSDGDRFQDLNFSMFFIPDDGNRRHNVNFELFTANEVEAWQRGQHDKLTNFGAGMLVSRDGDFNTGERIWAGTVLEGNTYFLAVENGSDVEIDYWLFDDDIYNNPELDPGPEPAPAPVFARGAAPQTALPLTFGRNVGGLEPGQEIWYSFSIDDNDEEYFEEMALTMIATPDDGNRIHHITFELFTANGVQNWSPGDNSQINNVGAGSLVVRDNNPLTGERFWTGWVVEDNLYYVQIRNGNEVHIDYWLFADDVYGPELGPIGD